ncbi:MAG: HlyD family efflux transporter periplasmic adaptor subunit, partial [Pseudomonadota bacterium]
RRLAPAAAAALLVGAMFLPWPDRIRAEAVLEPESRRFVSAGFSAVIETLAAEPGDLVRAGDVIAALDGEALRLERDAAAARRDEALRRRDAALRDGRVTEAELSRLAAEAADAETDLLDWRLARLVLRAPIDGIVLASAFEDADGAPVREGDVIAEVAPLERLEVRVFAPLLDLERLGEAGDGRLHLDGVSGAPIALGPLEPGPRAEAHDGAAALPLTTVIANPDGALRPGQRGVAILPTGDSTLGAVLFRRAWAAARRWLL